MLQRILDGVIYVLYQEFGVDIPIYTETVTQGLKRPCFMVFLESPSTTFLRGNRYVLSTKVCVHYVSKSTDLQMECMAVAERLFRILGCVTLKNGALRGKQRKYEVVDGVLRFFVRYDYQFFDMEQTGNEENTELMESFSLLQCGVDDKK